MFNKNLKAFTLIELMVVITILWVLAAIWIASYGSFIASSRDTKRVSDITEITKSLQTFDERWYMPVRLSLITKDFDEYPTDPSNKFWYQYNVNSSWTPSWSSRVGWKWFVVCTNTPLEAYLDNDGNLLNSYLEDMELSTARDEFIAWTLANRSSGWSTDLEPIALNRTIWYFCSWKTSSFDDLLAWGGSNSVGQENCSESLLNPSNPEASRWSACRIIFNQNIDWQALWASPSQWTPIPLPQQ